MQYNKYRSLCTAQGAWHPATELQPTGGNTQENQTSSWKMQTWGIMNLQREVTLMKHYRKQLDRFKLSWHPWNVVPINQDYSLTVKSVSKRLDIKRQRLLQLQFCCVPLESLLTDRDAEQDHASQSLLQIYWWRQRVYFYFLFWLHCPFI